MVIVPELRCKKCSAYKSKMQMLASITVQIPLY